MSTPTTRRAPCCFSQAPKYAVPQPSSMTSRPARSGSRRSSDSGTDHMPQLISGSFQALLARASVYSALFGDLRDQASGEVLQGLGGLVVGAIADVDLPGLDLVLANDQDEGHLHP